MSKPSYEKINYALRPAKNIERKMIVEALGRLRAFHTLDSYQYIGLGSPYFADFLLVHRYLGLSDMICIEREVMDQERFKFNRPFGSIALKFGKSAEILPTLSLDDRPTVVWLDYDDYLDPSMLSDIDILCSSLTSGSFLLVSMRCYADDFGKVPSDRLKKLTEALGDKIPAGISNSDLSGSKFGKLLWRIIDAEIRYMLGERSAGYRPELKFNYQQVLHFIYRDGIPMLTVGGALYQQGQRMHLTQCDFESLSFSRTDDDPYKIEAPPLTFKERQAIDAHLPATTPQLPGVPTAHVKEYARHYRYFPNFVDAEV